MSAPIMGAATSAPDVPYLRPASLAEALRARAEHPEWLVLAGCTDIGVTAPHRPPPAGLLDVFGLPELCGVREVDGGLRIGAATTYAAILRAPAIRATLPALWDCVREIGAAQIQARGTLGGNVATSSPVGDTLPLLLALDAAVMLASAKGIREVAYRDFVTGYRTTVLAAGELITAVRFPVPAQGTVQRWRKVGTRQAQAISKVALAATARLEDGNIAGCRLAMGAVADRPIRLPAIEALLDGRAPDTTLADEAAEATRKALTPIDDVRSSAAYRRGVAAKLVRRFVLDLTGAY